MYIHLFFNVFYCELFNVYILVCILLICNGGSYEGRCISHRPVSDTQNNPNICVYANRAKDTDSTKTVYLSVTLYIIECQVNVNHSLTRPHPQANSATQKLPAPRRLKYTYYQACVFADQWLWCVRTWQHALKVQLSFNCNLPKAQFWVPTHVLGKQPTQPIADEHFMFSRCVISNLTEAR